MRHSAAGLSERRKRLIAEGIEKWRNASYLILDLRLTVIASFNDRTAVGVRHTRIDAFSPMWMASGERLGLGTPGTGGRVPSRTQAFGAGRCRSCGHPPVSKSRRLRAPATKDTCRERSSDSDDLFVFWAAVNIAPRIRIGLCTVRVRKRIGRSRRRPGT